MAEQQANEIILLVGGNPLPNYVAALALRTELETNEVHLLYTGEVEHIKNNLSACLQTTGFGCRDTYIADAGDATVIRSACADIGENTHLHYTGGTNAMAAHVHAVWTKKGGTPEQASYLFGRDDRLMTDAGGPIDIPDDIHLDLGILASLHGLKYTHSDKSSGAPTLDDAEVIARYVFEDPNERKGTDDKVHDCLSEGWAKYHGTKVWGQFLRAIWLEEWVYKKIKDTKCVEDRNLHADIHVSASIGDRDFQLDVVAIRGHHLFLASCTTSQNLNVCKLKLFEVSTRARQLGGDLARSALVCLVDRDKEGRGLVEELEKDVRSLSESTRVPQVFGLRHVREWAGNERAAPNLSTLKNWLNS